MERVGLLLFDVSMRLLPGWLRQAAGAEMRDGFERRQREIAGRRGSWALPPLWLRESLGLLLTAYRSRRPDGWTRRTAPEGSLEANRPPPTTRPHMDNLRGDVAFALRHFRRHPTTAALAVLTLSLGVGASTAMFSVVQSVLLRPLPYPEPDRLVSAYPGWPSLVGHPSLGNLADRGTWSWPDYFGVEERQDVFESMAAYAPSSVTFRGDGPPERLGVTFTTWQLFPMLGVTPAAGRLFDADDTREDHVALLSHDHWVQRYGADPAVVGRTLSLNDEPYVVVGVLPEGLEVYGAGSDPALWIVTTGSLTDGNIGNHGSTRAVARLAEGVSIERASEGITAIFQEILPEGHGEHVGSVFPRHQDETRTARPVVLAMLVASCLLLLVACGNVAALLLGAGIDRERELAVRGAVGAARARITGQLLVESAVLSLAAVAGGVASALLLTKLLLWIAPTGVPGLADASLDGTVLAFALLASVGCGVGFGLVPAVSLSAVDLAEAMGAGRGTSARRIRLQSTVVVGELALTAVLVTACLLLGRTVGALNRIEPGFDVDRLAVVAFATPYQRFVDEQGATDTEALEAYQSTMLQAVASLPGVASVATTSVPPLTGYRGNNEVNPEGWEEGRTYPVAERRFVSADFFETTGIRIVAGRGLEASDYADGAEDVVVVSEGLAALAWPGADPIGRTLGYWSYAARVVGVAANVRDESLEDPTELAFYAPGTDGPFLVRAEGDPAALLPGIRERIWSIDPDVPFLQGSPLTELVAGEVSEELYRARLMTVFAGLAAFLTLMGIYGVTSRSVARRTRELGIRVALGAARSSVHGLVTLQAVRLAVVGAAAGLLVSIAGGRLIESFVWGVSVTDPLTLWAVGLGLPALAALAALGPARRATRVDPLDALKVE